MKKTEMIEDRLALTVYNLNSIRAAIVNDELTEKDLEKLTVPELEHMLDQLDSAVSVYLVKIWRLF